MSLKRKNGVLKITSHDGTSIQLQTSDGQIWLSCDEKDNSFYSPAIVYNHACTLYKVSTLENKYDKYYPVYLKIMRFAKKFGIRKLRFQEVSLKTVKYGKKVKSRYGYVGSNRFRYLMKRRKQKREQHDEKVVLLKKSDITWKDE